MRTKNLSLPAVDTSSISATSIKVAKKAANLFVYRSPYYDTIRVRAWVWTVVAVGLIAFVISVAATGFIDHDRNLKAIANKHHYENGEKAVCYVPTDDNNNGNSYWVNCTVITQSDSTDYSVSNIDPKSNKPTTNNLSVENMKVAK